MIKHLYLVRHGETVFNSEGKIQGGGLDSPLTPSGIEQAEKLSKYFKEQNFTCDHIFSSPLERAFQTAKIISGHLNINIKKDSLLKEIDCGEFEGKLISSIDSEKLRKLRIDSHEKYPSGESVEDVKLRAEIFIKNLKKLDGDSALIFSHGNFLRAFAAAGTGMSGGLAMKIYLENTGFSYLFLSGEYYRISFWNSTTHFGIFPKKILV